MSAQGCGDEEATTRRTGKKLRNSIGDWDCACSMIEFECNKLAAFFRGVQYAWGGRVPESIRTSNSKGGMRCLASGCVSIRHSYAWLRLKALLR